MAAPKRNRRRRKSQRAARLAAIVALQALLGVASLHLRLGAPEAGAERTEVSYASPDGFRILASYYRPAGPSDRALIIFPDAKEGRRGWDSIADTLRAHGFHVLVPDLRGTGESLYQRGIRRDRPHFSETELAAISADAIPAIRFVREIPGTSVHTIALIGSGSGASCALQKSTRGSDTFVRILVSPASLGIGKSDSSSVPGDLLTIIGRDDVLGTEAAAALAASDRPRECWLVDGSGLGAELMRGRVDLLVDLIRWIEREIPTRPRGARTRRPLRRRTGYRVPNGDGLEAAKKEYTCSTVRLNGGAVLVMRPANGGADRVGAFVLVFSPDTSGRWYPSRHESRPGPDPGRPLRHSANR